MPGKSRSWSSPPAKSARLAFLGTSALKRNMLPPAGEPTGEAAEEEEAPAEEARRSGVSGTKSAARRSAQ